MNLDISVVKVFYLVGDYHYHGYENAELAALELLRYNPSIVVPIYKTVFLGNDFPNKGKVTGVFYVNQTTVENKIKD